MRERSSILLQWTAHNFITGFMFHYLAKCSTWEGNVPLFSLQMRNVPTWEKMFHRNTKCSTLKRKTFRGGRLDSWAQALHGFSLQMRNVPLSCEMFHRNAKCSTVFVLNVKCSILKRSGWQARGRLLVGRKQSAVFPYKCGMFHYLANCSTWAITTHYKL